ncbi:MAG: SH3 domain-containing protein, partial [Lachnospiraceae bacterium]|nr:SH3 domain-containing protein [Lachnospiraceae bacterium]
MVEKKKRRKIMKISKVNGRKAAVFLILLVTLFLRVRGEDGIREAEASAVGIVSVSGGTMLNVRTGAGTNYAVVTSGGTKVTLSNGTKVTITGTLGDWYHVKFPLNAKTVKGYVSAKYVKVQTGSVVTKVYGKTTKACKIRMTAASSGEVLKVNDKEVSIKSGKKVRILSETLEGTKKWYRISVTVSGVKCKGYILSRVVGLTVGSSGLAGIVESAKTVSTYEDVANKKLAYSGTKKITLQSADQVTILDDMLISNKKYLQVQFSFQGKDVKALVADSKVFLQIVKA